MASGFTMVPTTSEGNAKMKGITQAKSKPAGKQAVKGGPSSGMHKFSGAGPQAPDKTAVTKHSGKGAPFPKGGPSGKMAKFTPVKAAKKA